MILRGRASGDRGGPCGRMATWVGRSTGQQKSLTRGTMGLPVKSRRQERGSHPKRAGSSTDVGP